MRCIPGCPVTAVAASVGLYPAARACVTMLGVTTVAGIAALCLQPRQIASYYGRSVTICTGFIRPGGGIYHQSPSPVGAERRSTMLDGYYREGEPLRLGLGLTPANASASRYYAPFATGVRLAKNGSDGFASGADRAS